MPQGLAVDHPPATTTSSPSGWPTSPRHLLGQSPEKLFPNASRIPAVSRHQVGSRQGGNATDRKDRYRTKLKPADSDPRIPDHSCQPMTASVVAFILLVCIPRARDTVFTRIGVRARFPLRNSLGTDRRMRVRTRRRRLRRRRDAKDGLHFDALRPP